MLRYQRHFAGEGLHNRVCPPQRFRVASVVNPDTSQILRLHRPFLHRGWAQEKYRYSTDVCIKSVRSSSIFEACGSVVDHLHLQARVVIVSTHNIRDACRDIWFCYSHVGIALLGLPARR